MNPKGGNGSPRGNLREAITGTDPVPRWPWALAALLLLIPVFAVYKTVKTFETRAALNTAEAGRQSQTSFKDAQEKMRAGQAEVASTRSELQAATARAEKAEKQFAELANARAAVEAK